MVRDLKGPGRLVVVGITAIALVMIAACGNTDTPAATATPVAAAATATPVPTATFVPTSTPAPTATTAAVPTATQAPTATTAAPGGGTGDLDPALLADGKKIFEETAGGVGCAFCHGMDGKGNGPSGLGAPENRCKTRDRLEWALGGGETGAMTFFTLSEHEKEAVLEYLQYLCTQP